MLSDKGKKKITKCFYVQDKIKPNAHFYMWKTKPICILDPSPKIPS